MNPTQLTAASLGRRPRGSRLVMAAAAVLAGVILSPPSAEAGRSRVVAPQQDPTLLTQVIERPAEEKSLSPYFVILSSDTTTEQLPLKFTAADVDVAGVIADVTVTQVYANTGLTPIEARYVFPASTHAAVHGMTMTIGDRVIEAQIQRRAEARANYEAAKAQGKSASLLEQQRPNVFEMNVANIMPGDEIQVELRYTEMLVPTDGIYEFVYPTVVGPRYSETPEAGAPSNETFVKSPYLGEGAAPTYGFDFTATLATGIPIQGVGCPSHEVDVEFKSPTFASITLDESEVEGGNRDVVLRYRLDGGQVETGLMVYEEDGEGYFMLMAQPPRRVAPEIIPPREYIFVVDVSGSMRGYPLDISKKLLRDLIGGLRPTDTFNVVLFASASAVMSERSLPANAENLKRAINTIDNQRGGGGTQLLPALQRSMELPRTKGASRSIVVVTDGYVSVESQAFDLIREHLDEANVFAFGIGSSVNRFIIEGMARVGQGEPMVITDPSEAPKQAERFRKYIEAPVLTGVTATFEGFDAYDLEPPAIPDVLAQRPVVVVGKFRGPVGGTVKVEGWTGDGAWSRSFNVAKAQRGEENEALAHLWARQRIATLDDYNQLRSTPERVEEVTQLGLTYNLLTAYTSFVAIDSKVRNTTGQSTSVDQPLPLPEGVSADAVGGAAQPVPAPPAMMMVPATREMESLNVSSGAAMGGGGYGAAKTRRMDVSTAGRAAPRPAPEPMGPVGALGSSSAGDFLEMQPTEKKKLEEGADKDVAYEAPASTAVHLTSVAVDAGALDQAAVERQLKGNQAQLRRWYARAVKADPNLKGRIVLRLAVGADGAVTSVTVTGGDAAVKDSAQLEGLRTIVGAWRLAAPADGGAAQVTLTLILG